MPIKVFISHAWDYAYHYDKLSEWVFDTNWIDEYGNRILFENTSIPKNDPVHAQGTKAIEQAIAHRIAQSHVVLAPSAVYASHRRWIDFELQVANQLNVPIIQVNPWAQEKKSTLVQNYATHEVGWNSKSVITAILEATNALA